MSEDMGNTFGLPAVGSLAAYAAAQLLAQAACFSAARGGTGCEDCSARVTATLAQRLVLVEDSGGSSCPCAVTDAGGNRLTLLRVLPHDRADYKIAPGLHAWLTTSPASTLVCHALANLRTPSRPPNAS